MAVEKLYSDQKADDCNKDHFCPNILLFTIYIPKIIIWKAQGVPQ